MGHDIHFLTRLDRVSLPHVELAMSLYNDTPLMKFILGKARLPDGAERVAISLDDPVQGPFLVVSRSGHFVTCLGEGMSTQDLPVITRSQLDALAGQATELRERMAISAELVGKGGKVSKLLRRIFTAGAELSREEFIGISAWQPLLCRHFLAYAIDSAQLLDRLRLQLRKVKDPPKSHDVPLLRDYWNHLWAIGHLMLLFANEAREVLAGSEIFERVCRPEIPRTAVRQGYVPVSIRGAWAAGKLGKPLLSGCKAAIAEPQSPMHLTTAIYSLMALATRHSRLRGEIRKALQVQPRCPDDAFGKVMRGIVGLAASSFEIAFDHRDEMLPFHEEIGGELFLRQARRAVMFGRPEASLDYASPAEVPENLRLAALANTTGVDLHSTDAMMHVILTLPKLAALPPEDLYYPAEVLETVGTPFLPDLVAMLVREHLRPLTPLRAEKLPGRNDPCSCGSGQKYKRCCAQKSDAEAELSGG